MIGQSKMNKSLSDMTLYEMLLDVSDVSTVTCDRHYGRKISWNVKRYGKYGRKVSWIVKWYGKYGRFLC
jgi:hypothetical protein